MRSRAGSQVLAKAEFQKVLNMTGGISSWNGHKASGSEEMGLEYFITGDYSSALEMAYAMEHGLQQFYQALADQADQAETKELLQFMARLEDGHMAKLSARYPSLPADSDDKIPAPVAEGGIDINIFIERFGDQLRDTESIIQAGMMFETQAFDMYSRLAQKDDDTEREEFYLEMAAEEQRHLDRLSKELDKRL